jgi:hypothetical protein
MVIEQHILFDWGMGAIDSLIDVGAPWVNHLFISHGHPYHSLGLDRLVFGHLRHGGSLPIPVYCTSGTCKMGPKRIYPWFFKNGQLQHEKVLRWQPKKLGLGIELKVTPVQVYQGPSAPGASIWVVEFGDQHATPPTRRKLVLGWEFVHFVPRFPGEDKDQDYKGRVHPDGLSLRDYYGDLFTNVDELFFDGNTRFPNPKTHHMSIQAALRFLIPQIQPRRTWILHYSGHEDSSGPMSDEELQDWVDQEKLRGSLGKSDICVARHGMQLRYAV